MEFFELKCKAYLKQDINFKESFKIISKYISYTISTSHLKDLHFQNNFIQRLQMLNKTPQTIQITKNGKKIRLFGKNL